MPRILTLSLNPTIDVSSEADLVRPTHKIRTFNDTYEPGGGGINVARAIHELGGEAEVLCLAGGVSGDFLDYLLKEIPLDHRMVKIAGNTRIALMVYERSTGHEFRFVPAGPTLAKSDLDACMHAIEETEFAYLVASGSLPVGAPPDILSGVAEIVADKGAKFILDSSGAGLRETLAHTPVYLVKPSLSELEGLSGRRLDAESAEHAATELVEEGHAEIVAVTMGAAGALIASRNGVFRLQSPQVVARSAVGAGDSFLAGMTLALSRGWSLEEAAAYGVAAGAAAVTTAGTTLCRREDVERLHRSLPRAA